jgi:hypothetical protein
MIIYPASDMNMQLYIERVPANRFAYRDSNEVMMLLLLQPPALYPYQQI